MFKLASRRRAVTALASLGLVASPLALGLATDAASANPAGTGLVIAEVYGAGGNAGSVYNADFVELYNPTGTAVSLSGLTLQYRSAAGGVGGTQALTGSVPAGSPFLVQMSAASTTTGAALPTPDLVASPAISMAAAGGQTILGTGTTFGSGNLAGVSGVTDALGASGATSFEGTAAGAATATQSLNRGATGADTDNNAADFTLAAPTPTPSSGGTTTPPGSALAATSPGAKSAVTGTAITPFNLSATGGTAPYSWTATGLPAGITVSSAGAVSGTATTAGTSSVTATVTDSAATPATASTTFTYTVTNPGAPVTIAQIQGDNTDTSPLAGTSVTTEGVVTSIYSPGTTSAGFTIQTGGTPGTPNASDGLQVFTGSNVPTASLPSIGSTVDVTGAVSEFNGLTEITAADASAIVAAATAQPAPVALTVLPGTDCVQGSCPTTAQINTARELHESEIFRPTGSYTVTDAYDGSPSPSTSSSNFGEIGLAAEMSTPLVGPTEDYDAQDQAPQIAARNAFNTAHEINIDDGSSVNFSAAANTGLPIPWFTKTHDVRVGAAVTFPKPVVLTWGNAEWRYEPQGTVVGDPGDLVHFAQTRAAYAGGPADVGGNVRLATFNVLNFFPTTGQEYVAGGGSCTYYNDRAGTPITDNTCTKSGASGPRGAATTVSLQRQQAKEVRAINSLGADVVSLEEIENSVQFGKDRDSALQILVNALNADAGAGTWAFPPSPAAADLPTNAEQDVIRTAFIYKPAKVALVGASKVLVGSTPFNNAREPLAQAFKKVGDPDSNGFGVIVNHFKSKGSGADDGTGQGNANLDRVNQAKALLTFADDFQTQRGISKMFLTGDFNAYSSEDPVQTIEAGGYTALDDTIAPFDLSYNFGGTNGSLDHVFANTAADAGVTGTDVWAINAFESVYFEYSRYNYNVTDLYDTTPFRSSDHNPEVVGINTGTATTLAPSTTTGTAATFVYGAAGSVSATVTGTGGTPSGTVTVSEGATTLGTITLGGSGTGSLTLPARSLPAGSHTLTLAYSGDATFAASTGTVTLTVTKAAASVAASASPSAVVVATGTSSVTTTVTATGSTPTGTVEIYDASGTLLGSGTLTNGSVSTTVGPFATAGGQTLTAKYLGDTNTDAGSATTTLTVTPASSVTLNLLNINDFHGRVDSSITPQLATQIEKLRAAGGASSSLLLSAGDNIGASLFASSSAQDNPAIDVLNALELQTSAVGNHEFDQGFGDLTGHVADRDSWEYLGANVYLKGTTTPALPEYRIFTVNGIKVGVIGTVTQETPSLVNPSGIANLDFGDPVDATNRVAAQLTDGDAANGEADVLVAEYHEGAPNGDVENATLATNTAASPVFAKIVNQTSPKVAAIFTGHTHKRYAYSAPVPGTTTGATRPVVQTGNYGDFVGHVTLTVDTTTKQVTAHTEENVARGTATDLTFPRVQQVKNITDAAVAAAAQLGNQPVGTITADITTAFSGGTYTGTGGAYTGGTRDDRASESTLGDLVAQALKDGVSAFGDPDLGVTNPGGLRAELLYAADTSSNPMNTAGTVTYAEANSVLPFNNTVALVKLTGAQLENVLEQQYQTNADGSVPTRPYLQLGLSDNVRVTTDPTKAAGSRITSVYIDDVPLDPAKVYTVSTLSFLASGGDNFRAFTAGTSTDTGLLDAQLFRSYFQAHPNLVPDFARQQVTESGKPDVLVPGTPSTFTLSKLDLTSQGSPTNTTVTARIGDSVIGTYPVTAGSATVAITVPTTFTTAGDVVLTASPSGTKVTIPYSGAPRSTPTITATTTPAKPSVYKDAVRVDAQVASDGATPTGTITVSYQGTDLGTSGLDDRGVGTVRVRPFTSVGTVTLDVTYSGDAATEPVSTTTTVTIVKQVPTVKVVGPSTIKQGKAPLVKVNVSGVGPAFTGKVTIKYRGTTVTRTLSKGATTLRLRPLTLAGTFKVTATYLGTATRAAATGTKTITVVKK